MDLLSARLTGEGVPRAVDSRTLLARWRRVGDGGALSQDQALTLARELGAGRLVTGELVRTSAQTSVRGRLLQVPTGALVVEHAESAASGQLDELGLIDRWVGRVFAAGEGGGRLAQLSDSTEAVKAFLAGREAHKRDDVETAAANYGRALAIDSTFALAAYWLAAVNERRGSLAEGILEGCRRAWLLRDRLSEADRAQLLATLCVGPRYPERYTSAEIVGAAERAAELNPDRAEAFERLGGLLVIQGAAASADDWLPRAVVALDSAARLDSTRKEVLWWRLYAALIGGDLASARRVVALYLPRAPPADWADAARWMAAYALEDSAAMREIHSRLDHVTDHAIDLITAVTTNLALPLPPLDTVLTRWSGDAMRDCQRFQMLQPVAAMRGQLRRALALADSANRAAGCGLRYQTLLLALAESGYGPVPDRIGAALAPYADTTTDNADAICGVELWRVSRGDTLRTRRAIDRMTGIIALNRRPVPVGVGSLGLTSTSPAGSRPGAISPADSPLRAAWGTTPTRGTPCCVPHTSTRKAGWPLSPATRPARSARTGTTWCCATAPTPVPCASRWTASGSTSPSWSGTREGDSRARPRERVAGAPLPPGARVGPRQDDHRLAR